MATHTLGAVGVTETREVRKENQVVVYTQSLIMHRHAQKTEMIDG